MSRLAHPLAASGALLLAGMAVCILCAAPAAALPPGVSAPPLGSAPPEGVDLDVTYISRTPLYRRYCVDYTWDVPGQPGLPFVCPGTEAEKRWPDPGEIVTFTAHIRNKGTQPSPAFDFEWQIDGVPVAGGTLPPLAPAAEATADYLWPWAHGLSPDGQRVLGDHTVGFSVDPQNAVAETYEVNNRIEDRTNALSVRVALTPAGYDACNTPLDPIFPYSAEDWIQKHIARWNRTLAESLYPTTPAEATDRVRLDSIVIAAADPPDDRTHDVTWFLAGDDCRPPGQDPAEDIDWGLIHEMCHKTGLIDLYQLNIEPVHVHATDRAGNPVNMGFIWPNGDLMTGGDTAPYNDARYFSSHTAGGSASNKGYRRGFYGEYLYDLPEQNWIEVRDNQGHPAAGVQVTLYQRSGPVDWTDSQTIDPTPEIDGTTGPDGRLLLPNRPARGGTVTATGHVLHDNPFGPVDIVGIQDRFLMRLRLADHEEFRWLDITELNLAAWAGDTLSHTLALHSHVPPAGAPPAPQLRVERVEGDRARLCWQYAGAQPPPGVTGYRVYRAAETTYAYERIADGIPGPCLEDAHASGSYWSKVYAVTALDDQGRESGFSNLGWAPTLSSPAAVVITPQGQRVILDPRNGYALMLQAGDGAYRQYVGSVHFHLEFSQFLALDAAGRLLFSHPGDGYVDRHSVRVATLDITPLLEFGERGSQPGQFETPAGVAGWGAAPGRILVADSGNHRVQAFDSQGTLVAVYGSQGGGAGQFRDPQGLAVGPDGRVIVVDRGNNRLAVLSFDGHSFGWAGSYAHGFQAPTAVAVDRWGRLAVADTGNNRVVLLDPAGGFLAQYTQPDDGYAGPFNAPRGVAFEAGGALVVADTGNQRVVTVRSAAPAVRRLWLPLVLRPE